MRAALVAALLALCGPVAAREPAEAPDIRPTCRPLPDVLADMPEDATWQTMPEEAVSPMLILHNALPPPSHDTYAEGIIIETKGGALIYWTRLHGAYACDLTQLPPPMWKHLRPLIEGRRV